MLRFDGHWRSEALIRRGLAYGVFTLCTYAAWMRAGTYPPLQWPMTVMAALMCAAVIALPAQPFKKTSSLFLRDPVFYSGAVFLLLLLIQWINSGYWVSPGDASGAVVSRIPSKWLPWSVDRAGAAEMLSWFFPALVLLLLVRNVLHRSDLKIIVHLMVWNSALLACAGILQYMLDLDRIFGIWAVSSSEFFATFDYPNHASAWFYLHAALAGGLAHDAEIKRKPRIRVVVWGACFLCCIAACCLTLSRYGAMVTLTQLLAVFSIFLLQTRKYLRGRKALNAGIFMAIIVLGGMTLFYGAGGGDLAQEMGGKSVFGEQSIVADLSGRTEHISTAWCMITDYPFFGVGGWGCDGLADLYIEADELRSWMVAGRANVHCDPVQFLAELGLLGGLCMAVIMAVLFKDAIAARRTALTYWVAGGLVAVLGHSLIDLPFRCPAILLAWCCLLAALPCLAKRRALEG